MYFLAYSQICSFCGFFSFCWTLVTPIPWPCLLLGSSHHLSSDSWWPNSSRTRMNHLYPVPRRPSRWMTSWQRCRRLSSQASARHPREVGPESDGSGDHHFCVCVQIEPRGFHIWVLLGLGNLRCKGDKRNSVFMGTQGSLGMRE